MVLGGVPSDYSKILYKSGSKYLARLIYDYRKNPRVEYNYIQPVFRLV